MYREITRSRALIFIKILMFGLLRGLILLLIYLIFIPYVFNLITVGGVAEYGLSGFPSFNISTILLVLLLFTSLEAIAITLKGNVIGFLASSLSKLLGLLLLFKVLNNGILEGNAVIENVNLIVKIDISPLLILVAVYTFILIIFSSIELHHKE